MTQRWLVLDMDDGLLRREPTRRAALAWFMDHCDAPKVISRHRYGPGAYDYRVGSDPEDAVSAFIEREDVAPRGGWDPQQPALYPLDDKPHEQVERQPDDAEHAQT